MSVSLKEERAARKAKNEQFRIDRLGRLLGRPDVIAVARLDLDGVRLSHINWPVSKYIDYWPRSCAYLRSNGKSGVTEWKRLLKRLGVQQPEEVS
jgi:hypothetical protein